MQIFWCLVSERIIFLIPMHYPIGGIQRSSDILQCWVSGMLASYHQGNINWTHSSFLHSHFKVISISFFGYYVCSFDDVTVYIYTCSSLDTTLLWFSIIVQLRVIVYQFSLNPYYLFYCWGWSRIQKQVLFESFLQKL